MARFLHCIRSFAIRKWDKVLLALCWILGLFVGGIVFGYIGGEQDSLISLALTSRPSFAGLLMSALLPFLLSAVAISMGTPRLLYGLCFCKAFMIGYLCFGVFSVHNAAGWLICRLFLFTDLCASPVLYLYWHRHISGVRGFSILRSAWYPAVLSLIAGIDFYYIAPLLRRCLL